jgi:CRP-like cAMP-binding protein
LVWDGQFDKQGVRDGYLRKSRSGLRDSRSHSINLSEAAKMEALQKCHIFKSLEHADVRELASQATAAVFGKGSFIFTEGDPSNFFYVVYDGLVQVYKTSGSGKNVTFTIATRGDTLTASALSIDSYFVSAQAMQDVTVLKIGRKEFLAFLNGHIGVAMGIIEIMAHRLNREYERIVDIVGEEVELRLVHSLCLLAGSRASSAPP